MGKIASGDASHSSAPIKTPERDMELALGARVHLRDVESSTTSLT